MVAGDDIMVGYERGIFIWKWLQRLKFHPALLGLVSSDILIFSVELVLWDLDPEFFLWRSLYFLGKSHFCGILQRSSKETFIIFISWVLPATACVHWMWWNSRQLHLFITKSDYRLHNNDYRRWSWWRWINVDTWQQPQLYWMKPPGEKCNIGRPFLSTAHLTSLFTVLDPNMWVSLLFRKTPNKPWCWATRMKMQHGAKIKPGLSENVHTRAEYTRQPEWGLRVIFKG